MSFCVSPFVFFFFLGLKPPSLSAAILLCVVLNSFFPPFFLFFVYKYAGEGEEGISRLPRQRQKGVFVFLCVYAGWDLNYKQCKMNNIHFTHTHTA